jgi:hypothetical protein
MTTFLHLLAFLAPAFQDPKPAPVVPPVPAPAPAPAPAPQTTEQGKVRWTDKSAEIAFVDAKKESRLVMAFFGSELSYPCTRMMRETFSDDRVAAALEDVLCLKLDVDKDRGLAARHLVKEAPVVLWFNPDGTVRERIDGFQVRDVFLAQISRIKVDIGTINELRTKVAAKGDDLETRYDLHKRLKAVGDAAGAAEQRAAIEKQDPQGKSRGMHYFKYEKITGDIEDYWAKNNNTLDMKRVADLQAFVEVETEPWIIWDGWMRLSNTHNWLGSLAAKDGKLDEAADHRVKRRDFLARAWRGIPEEHDLLHNWCYTYAGIFWDERAELTPSDKSFYLILTGRMIQLYDEEALAHDLRARALFLSGKRAEAVEECKRAIELEPTNDMYKNRLKEVSA